MPLAPTTPRKPALVRGRAALWILACAFFLGQNLRKISALRAAGLKPTVGFDLVTAFFATALAGWSYVAWKEFRRTREARSYAGYSDSGQP